MPNEPAFFLSQALLASAAACVIKCEIADFRETAFIICSSSFVGGAGGTPFSEKLSTVVRLQLGLVLEEDFWCNQHISQARNRKEKWRAAYIAQTVSLNY